MKKRDTERKHVYADKVFNNLEIYDIQGLLKEEEEFKCGLEAYQVGEFSSISFDNFSASEELARFAFCEQLMIPYYIIITSEKTSLYRIYETNKLDNKISYDVIAEYSEDEFVLWWRSKQSFTQSKPMYNATARIKDSMIDKLLFANSLAWGVNVDGFSIDKQSGKVNAIYEKRICTYNPPKYTIKNYDPNRFFHGTFNRSGDFPSWNILYRLSKSLNVPLLLFTFETSDGRNVGASKIMNVDQRAGLTYLNGVKPFNNIFQNDISNLKEWLSINFLKSNMRL